MKLVAFGVVVLLSLSVYSCGQDIDLLPNQKDAISKYFDSKNLEYTIQDGVYKHIANADREGYKNETVIYNGDSVIYNFEAYTFTSLPGKLFYTNKPELIETLVDLNPRFWPQEPIRIKAGSTPQIKGLANAIPYCRRGDSVVLLITSDLAFDDHAVGTVPSNTAIMYILNIENVKK